ncbi:MAG: 50S ribosomal protein L11 methyltransferase [Neomegalonema sp.]|nr:50S ribosomal protein L11 methyltransferase [Neomegalonema sp.]
MHSKVANPDAVRELIICETRVFIPSIVPELRYWGVDEETPLWAATEATLEQAQLPPPFWAFAWPGGQGLARFLLDTPDRARGRNVLALAAGGALEAVAAARAGAARVVANDVDHVACVAAELNARLNSVQLETDAIDRLDGSDRSERMLAEFDLVLVGDAFYERALSTRLIAALERANTQGVEVLIGDAGRGGAEAAAFAESCHQIAVFETPTNQELEGVAQRRVRILQKCGNAER